MQREMASIVIVLAVVAGVYFLDPLLESRTLLAFSTLTPDYLARHGSVEVYVERVSVHRFYRIYSYVTGDRSHMEIELVIQHLNRENLPKEIPEVTLHEEGLSKVYPFPYILLSDYPPDDPLGYKLTLLCRFPPPEFSTQKIDISLHYLGKLFVIKEVPIR
jgi:hypothetical protein